MESKITFVCLYGDSFGGMERRYARLAEFLNIHRNVSIKLVTFKEALPTFIEIGIDVQNFELHTLEMKPWPIISKSAICSKFYWIFVRIKIFMTLLFDKSERIFFAHNPQVLYSTLMLNHSFFKGLFSKISSSVSVAAVDSILENYKIETFEALDSIYAIDALSPRIANYLKNHCKAPIYTAPCSFTDYKKVLRNNKRDIDILMVARFDNHKGYDLLEAASNENNHLNICVVGFGDQKPNIADATFKVSNDVIHLYSEAKIFLSLQRFSNYPSQSLLEAMASECAVIATDVGETRLLLDDTNSLLINYEAEELIEAIDKLISNPKLRAALGKNAREKAINEHRIDRYADYFMKNIIGEYS